MNTSSIPVFALLDASPFLIPIVAIVMSLLIPIVAIISDAKKKRSIYELHVVAQVGILKHKITVCTWSQRRNHHGFHFFRKCIEFACISVCAMTVKMNHVVRLTFSFSSS